MGMRSGTTFKKRQKEIARMEKQRDKAARRVQRKAEKLSGDSSGNSEEDDLLGPSDESAEPSTEVSVAAGESGPPRESAPPSESAPVHD